MNSLNQLQAQPVELPVRRGAQATPAPLRPERATRALQRRTGLAMLAPADLPLWDALVEESPQGSVFVKTWWLKASCGEARILGYFDPNRLLAGIPLYYERRLGLKLCRMPKLTQTLGVVMRPLKGKAVAQETRATEILGEFAARLDQETVFIQAFHPSFGNWLPFYWRGFTQTTHYTYVLDDITSLRRVWDGMDGDRRANIRKARRLGLTVKECGPETVYRAAEASFKRQGRKCPFTLAYLVRLYEAARANHAGVCMAVVDCGGKVHAAECMAWDAKRSYGIAGGHDSALGASGGAALLRWTLIEFAAERTEVFDFEGSMRRPIETSFRSFGARRVGYLRIVKAPRWLRAGLCLAGRAQI